MILSDWFRRASLWQWGAVGLLFLGLLAMLIGQSMGKPLAHDEHQFVASAVLVASEGLQPYRDFPCFHMPNLVYAYALLFHLTGHYLLSARLVSVVCGWLLLVLIFGVAYGALRGLKGPMRMAAALACVLILSTNHLFTYTSGWAWNHAVGVLLGFSAAVVHHRALWARKRALLGVSGLLLGGAIGARLSWAPLVAPFLLAVWVGSPHASRSWSWSGANALVFVIGCLIGLLPTTVLFLVAPEQVIFGNLIYPQLNTRLFVDRQGAVGISFWAKSFYLLTRVFSDPSAVFLALPVSAVWLIKLRGSWKSAAGTRFWFALALLPFVIAGAFAPTPCQYQYLYALIPFLLLAAIDATAILMEDASRGHRRFVLGGFMIAAGIASFWGLPAYRPAAVLLHPDQWAPVQIERQGAEIARCAGTNAVITIAPIYPLAGGARIHPGCVQGALAWRVGHYLSQPERERLHILCEDNLAPVLAAGGVVVLLGSERADEEVGMERVAQEQGFELARLAPPWRIYALPGQGQQQSAPSSDVAP